MSNKTKKRFVIVRTKNRSADPLRRSIETDRRVVLRLGSRTPLSDIYRRRVPRDVIEINSIEAVINSRDKLLMKRCFASRGVPQADAYLIGDSGFIPFIIDSKLVEDADPVLDDKLPYPVLAKRRVGYQGRGMQKLSDVEELRRWLRSCGDGEAWIIEKFYNYAREYRVHVVSHGIGVILSWRKLRMNEVPPEERWFFNSHNSVWIREDNELFDRPFCWDRICKAAADAIESVGLDIGAVDVRVQSNKNVDPSGERQKFIICETNSAPTLSSHGIEIYKKTISELINRL